MNSLRIPQPGFDGDSSDGPWLEPGTTGLRALPDSEHGTPTASEGHRTTMLEDLMQLVQARTGHFLLESGHHGDLWLDLELLCLRPGRIQPLASQLARRLAAYHLDAVCGPLVEGAFVALLVAQELDVPFWYTEQLGHTAGGDLYPMSYRLPAALRRLAEGKRVAVVNDVINAGSAVRGTFLDLASCRANTVVMASLLTLGDTPRALADELGIDLITLGSQSSSIWTPAQCPMCADNRSLDDV